MKLVLRRADAFLILLAFVVYKSSAHPVTVCLIGVSILFIIGAVIDDIAMIRKERRRQAFRKRKAEQAESARRFRHLLAIMYDAGTLTGQQIERG